LTGRNQEFEIWRPEWIPAELAAFSRGEKLCAENIDLVARSGESMLGRRTAPVAVALGLAA